MLFYFLFSFYFYRCWFSLENIYILLEGRNVGSFVLPLISLDVENRLMQPNPFAFQVLLAAPATALLFLRYRSSTSQDVFLSFHRHHGPDPRPRVPALSIPRALPWETPRHLGPIWQRLLQLPTERTLPSAQLPGDL